MTGKGSRTAVKHQLFKDKARNRVDDLQDKFSDLQSAIKDSRTADVTLLEAQVHQMLREWKAELNEPSPASSLQGNTHVSSDPPSEILRLLQLSEIEDDATSKLMELAVGNSNPNPNPNPNPKPEPEDVIQSQSIDGGTHLDATNSLFHEAFYINQADAYLYSEEEFKPINPSQDALTQLLEQTCHLDYSQFLSLPNPNPNPNPNFTDPSAFLRPKCALWDCQRPAQGLGFSMDYCSTFHASLARDECPPGMTPVLRPGGIDLKDGPLFAALSSRILGKEVGIPVCEGAATTKSPWNAPELFNLAVLEGESIREWLFFDKPRRAFESGTRKQRSLPDYSGRGWHESRKQVIKEFNGLKRSYYMDPQPLTNFEWHLYEYEINNCDVFALYRLEFKRSLKNSPIEGNKRVSRKGNNKGSGSKINNNNNNNNNEGLAFEVENGMVYGPHLPNYGEVNKLEGYYGT